MTGRGRAAALVAVLLAAAAPARADRGDDALTTPEWREPKPPLELGRTLLSLPEAAIETAFMPVGMAMTMVQHYRLDRRVHDLLRNDDGTIVVSPRFKLATGDGLGAGARLTLSRLLAADSALSFGAVGRLDRDWEVGAGYWQRVAALDGRRVELGVRAERDGNLRYFGIGNGSAVADERVIAVDQLEARGSFELTAPGTGPFRTTLEASAHRQRLAAGADGATPGLGQAGDPMVAPDDFGRTTYLARMALAMVHDSRDTLGRPTRGLQLGIRGGLATAVDGSALGAATLRAGAAWYLPVLPDKRVLVLSAGAAATSPLQRGHGIPLVDLVALGGRSHLRGFAGGRFRDRHGWWSAIEYRWPLWEAADREMAVDAALFAEVGRVAGSLTGLAGGPVHADAGVSLRAGSDANTRLQVDLARSNEGWQVGIGLSEEIGK